MEMNVTGAQTAEIAAKDQKTSGQQSRISNERQSAPNTRNQGDTVNISAEGRAASAGIAAKGDAQAANIVEPDPSPKTADMASRESGVQANSDQSPTRVKQSDSTISAPAGGETEAAQSPQPTSSQADEIGTDIQFSEGGQGISFGGKG